MTYSSLVRIVYVLNLNLSHNGLTHRDGPNLMLTVVIYYLWLDYYKHLVSILVLQLRYRTLYIPRSTHMSNFLSQFLMYKTFHPSL